MSDVDDDNRRCEPIGREQTRREQAGRERTEREQTGCGRRGPGQDRGQLVLLAAAAIAIALVPLALAYVGLGYSADVSDETRATPLADAERVLERVTYEAASTTAGEHDWSSRDRAVDAFRDRLDEDVRSLERSRLSSGVAYQVRRNESAAAAWSASNCPKGSDRRFGPCKATDGIVVQKRARETVVVAVAFDVHATTERGSAEMTIVVQPLRGA